MSIFYKMLAKMKARSVSESGAPDEEASATDEACVSSSTSATDLSSSQPVFPGVPDCPPVPSESVQNEAMEAECENTNIPLSVIREEDKIPIGNTPPGPVRPMERQQLRPWLIEQINKGDIKGLEWIDQNLKVFKIPWKHRSRCGWRQEADACLFKRWAVHTGRFVEGKDKADPRRWKANFRCAVNSRPDIEEVKAMTRKTGTDAYRVYRFLPESEGKLVKNLKNKFEKETRRTTKEYLSYVLHQHQQVRQEEPIDLSVSDIAKPNRDKKSLEAARALADLSKPFTKEEEREQAEASAAEGKRNSAQGQTLTRQQLESRFTDQEGFVWEVLRVKPEPPVEEQESISSDGEEAPETPQPESESGSSNAPSTPNPTTYVHAGLLSGGGLQAPAKGEESTSSVDAESPTTEDLSQSAIITKSITPMYTTGGQVVTSSSSSLASRHLTMKRALEKEPKTSLAGLLSGDVKKTEATKLPGNQSSDSGEPVEKNPRLESDANVSTASFMSGNGNTNSASRALLAAAAKHRMPMMMVKDGQPRTALPATVLGIKPTVGSSPPVAQTSAATAEGEASSFYRYNPMYGEEAAASMKNDPTTFYRYNPIYVGSKPTTDKESDKPSKLQTQSSREAADSSTQKLQGLGSLAKKTGGNGSGATSPGVLLTPIILPAGNGVTESPAKTTTPATQNAQSLLACLQKGVPSSTSSRRVMPNNVTVRTLLAASRAASGKPDPIEKVVSHNVKEILHNPTTANVVQPGNVITTSVTETARVKPILPVVSLPTVPSSPRPLSTPATPSSGGLTYSFVPDNSSIYLTNIANIVENTKKDLKQTEEQMGERFHTMEENIQKAVLEAYKSRLPDLVAQTVKEIMETHIEPLRREVAFEMERLKQQVAQLEQVQQATNAASSTTPSSVANSNGLSDPRPALVIPKPSSEILTQMHVATSNVPPATADDLNKCSAMLRPTQLQGLSQSQTVQFVPSINKIPQITIKALPGAVDKPTAQLPVSMLQLSSPNLQNKPVPSKPVVSLNMSSVQSSARSILQGERSVPVASDTGIILTSLQPSGNHSPKVASQLLQLASQVASQQGGHPFSGSIESVRIQKIDDTEQPMSCTIVPAITSTIMSTTTSDSFAMGNKEAPTTFNATPPASSLSVSPPSIASTVPIDIPVPLLTVELQMPGKTGP